MQNHNIDDCFLHDKDRLTHQEALAILKANITPKAATITLPLQKALGHILETTIKAPRPIPAHRNAAVDGYAYSDKAYEANKGGMFKLTHRIKAGDTLVKGMKEGATARIFTGAVLPENLDSVVMQEDVTLEEREGDVWVKIPPGLKPGANCRQAGEDTAEGYPLVERGTRLSPQHIAALAAGGINDITIYAPIKVACLSTGDEIIRKREDFQLGKVFDSNSPMLLALSAAQNCNVTDLGVIRDNPSAIMEALENAANSHDVIITSGGASKGEEDHILTALDKLGTRHMWQLAIKPGRPMCFGQINHSIFIGLPGNPVAAFICFLLYASPLLARLGGAPWPEPARFQVPANFEITRKKPDRREFLRGRLITREGITRAEKFEKDGSGLIQSLIQSNGLIELDEDITAIKPGDLVNFLPFSHWRL